jgi:hypothetical protein
MCTADGVAAFNHPVRRDSKIQKSPYPIQQSAALERQAFRRPMTPAVLFESQVSQDHLQSDRSDSLRLPTNELRAGDYFAQWD